MKKVYTKPEIMFEDFSLNNSITAGCEKIAQAAENACAYKVVTSGGTFNVFTTVMTGICNTYGQEGENGAIYNGICYHVPYASNNVFTS